MKRPGTIKALAVTGWGAGMTLILAGVPVIVVLAALAALAAAAGLLAWRGSALLAALTTWAKTRATAARKRRIKTGRAVEHA